MNWLNKFRPPKLKALLGKRDTPENLWVNCPSCGEMIFHRELAISQNVCPKCNKHMKLEPAERLLGLFDNGEYESVEMPDVPLDPLKFRDDKKYTDRIKEARANTGQKDAVITAIGKLDGLKVVVSVQNFKFMGGSLGMAAGEAIIRSAEIAIENKSPYILFTGSGGARMQEGIMSLMQMPRTTIAVQMLREAKLPYIVVLTDPTSGGVTASYAMLGDVQIAEPGALICFAGPRVIQQTIREELPEGFQRAEYLLDHGMVDMVVHRHELRDTLSRLCHILMRQGAKALPRAKAGETEKTTDDKESAGEPAASDGNSSESELEEVKRKTELAGQTP